MNVFKVSLIGTIFIGLLACSDSFQQADPNFTPKNTQRSFSDKNSPVVFIDEAHNNFLTANGRYRPFVQVLESDGYTVKPNKSRFTLERLYSADILVIANALDKNRKDWTPPFTQALTAKEVSTIKKWVLNGGSLFLVADHAPFPKIIENLAGELGFEFSNGHVGNAIFNVKNNTLTEHVITAPKVAVEPNSYLPDNLVDKNTSRLPSNRIKQVRTFGGSAFKTPPEARSLLTLGKRAISTVPEIPFIVNADTPKLPMHGWSQGAVMALGKGRVAVFAEGMMFSSQVDTKTRKTYGLTSTGAEQNERFLLNVMAWLAGAI